MLTKLQIRALSAVVMAPVFAALVYFAGWPFLLMLILAAGRSLYEWMRMARLCSAPLPWFISGVPYIFLSFYAFYVMREEYSFALTLLFVCMVWASDIGAYFFGKTFGGPKMAERISPNKTWAGMVGAMVVPALVLMIWPFLFKAGWGWDVMRGEEIVHVYPNVFSSLIVGLGVGMAGQCGDLLISLFKRQAEVKDSGSLIPGHGGLLDRIDAMMLTAPLFLLLAKYYLVG